MAFATLADQYKVLTFVDQFAGAYDQEIKNLFPGEPDRAEEVKTYLAGNQMIVRGVSGAWCLFRYGRGTLEALPARIQAEKDRYLAGALF